jgi:hypothetical protein
MTISVVNYTTIGTTATSYTLWKPSLLKDNDVLVTTIHQSASTGITAPSGWTKTVDAYSFLGGSRRVVIAYKIITDASSESSTYVFIPGLIATAILCMYVLRFADTSDLIEANSTDFDDVGEADVDLPALYPSNENCLIVSTGAKFSTTNIVGYNFTAGTGYTLSSDTGIGQSGVYFKAFTGYKQMGGTSGATAGNFPFGWSGGYDTGASIAINAGAGGTGRQVIVVG